MRCCETRQSSYWPKPTIHETGGRIQLPRGATPEGGSRRRRGFCSTRSTHDRLRFQPSRAAPSLPHQVPNEHAENAGTRKRRHPKSLSPLDPLENNIDVKPLLRIASANVAKRSESTPTAVPLLQRNPRLLHDFELNWTAGFMLDNRRSFFDSRDVVDAKADEIAAAQLTVDCKVEQHKIALTVLNLKSDPNSPDLFRPKGTLLANQTSFVPDDRRQRYLS